MGPGLMTCYLRLSESRSSSTAYDSDSTSSNGSSKSAARRCNIFRRWCTDRDTVLDILASISQISIVIVYVIVSAIDGNYVIVWSVPLSLVLMGFRLWENFLYDVPTWCFLGDHLKSSRARRSRVVIQLVASVWKIAVTLLMFFVITSCHVSFVDPTVNHWTTAFDIDFG